MGRTTTRSVLEEVRAERLAQNERWGTQNHAPVTWISLLAEELGEAAQQANDATQVHPGEKTAIRENHMYMREELIQIAAVAIAAVESLDRNELSRRRGDCQ